MAREDELVTVFRSADFYAAEEANRVRDMLVQAGIAAEVCDDTTPGVSLDTFEVRVPPEQENDAQTAINTEMALTSEEVDVSHDLDLVPVYVANGADSQMLATAIRSILDAQGIPSVLVSGSEFPNLPFEVRVPRTRLEEARQAIAAAEEAGPAAAEEAERETEAGGGAI